MSTANDKAEENGREVQGQGSGGAQPSSEESHQQRIDNGRNESEGEENRLEQQQTDNRRNESKGEENKHQQSDTKKNEREDETNKLQQPTDTGRNEGEKTIGSSTIVKHRVNNIQEKTLEKTEMLSNKRINANESKRGESTYNPSKIEQMEEDETRTRDKKKNTDGERDEKRERHRSTEKIIKSKHTRKLSSSQERKQLREKIIDMNEQNASIADIRERSTVKREKRAASVNGKEQKKEAAGCSQLSAYPEIIVTTSEHRLQPTLEVIGRDRGTKATRKHSLSAKDIPGKQETGTHTATEAADKGKQQQKTRTVLEQSNKTAPTNPQPIHAMKSSQTERKYPLIEPEASSDHKIAKKSNETAETTQRREKQAAEQWSTIFAMDQPSRKHTVFERMHRGRPSIDVRYSRLPAGARRHVRVWPSSMGSANPQRASFRVLAMRARGQEANSDRSGKTEQSKHLAIAQTAHDSYSDSAGKHAEDATDSNGDKTCTSTVQQKADIADEPETETSESSDNTTRAMSGNTGQTSTALLNVSSTTVAVPNLKASGEGNTTAAEPITRVESTQDTEVDYSSTDNLLATFNSKRSLLDRMAKWRRGKAGGGGSRAPNHHTGQSERLSQVAITIDHCHVEEAGQTSATTEADGNAQAHRLSVDTSRVVASGGGGAGQTKVGDNTSTTSATQQGVIDPNVVSSQAVIAGAMPVLPLKAAYLCLVLNTLAPGVGTVMGAVLVQCMGPGPRYTARSGGGRRCTSTLVCVTVAALQAYTVIFCLVGWAWAVGWGVMMVYYSHQQRKIVQQQVIDAMLAAQGQSTGSVRRLSRKRSFHQMVNDD